MGWPEAIAICAACLAIAAIFLSIMICFIMV